MTSQPKHSTFDALIAEPNLALAMQIASGTGKLLLDRPDDLGVTTKSTATDVVTLMDQAAEAFIVAELGKHRPNDAILGEEGANQVGTSGLQWVIDPIDGTVNYLHKVPHWCVSIGLMEESSGLALAGVVYVPVLDQMYISSRGLGAWVIERGEPRELPRRRGPARGAPGAGHVRRQGRAFRLAVHPRRDAGARRAPGGALRPRDVDRGREAPGR